MDQFMIDTWNKHVAPDDTVFHLGDFALGEKTWAKKIFNHLNGTKYIIIGNHDRGPKGLKDIGFLEAEYWLELEYKDRKILLVHNFDNVKKDPKNWDLIICGHVHSLWETKSVAVNVGVDIFKYKPLRIDQVFLKANILVDLDADINLVKKPTAWNALAMDELE